MKNVKRAKLNPQEQGHQNGVVQDVRLERERQDKKYGVNFGLSKEKLFIILAEEFGEVARAIDNCEGDNRLYDELIQVAAVAVRFATAIRLNEVVDKATITYGNGDTVDVYGKDADVIIDGTLGKPSVAFKFNKEDYVVVSDKTVPRKQIKDVINENSILKNALEVAAEEATRFSSLSTAEKIDEWMKEASLMSLTGG